MATQVTNLTAFADQVTFLQLADGTSVSMELIFNGTTERWTANITYGAVTINGLGLCCHPNILRQWMNILPFGLSVVTADQTDPFNVNDFSTGRALLYVLDASDVAYVEANVFGSPVQV